MGSEGCKFKSGGQENSAYLSKDLRRKKIPGRENGYPRSCVTIISITFRAFWSLEKEASYFLAGAPLRLTPVQPLRPLICFLPLLMSFEIK